KFSTPEISVSLCPAPMDPHLIGVASNVGPVPSCSGGLSRFEGVRSHRCVDGGAEGVGGVVAFGLGPGDEAVEVGPRVEATPQAAADEAVKDGTARAGFHITDEQPVLLAKGAGPDGVLHAVIVDLNETVVEVDEQAGPLAEGIGTGLAHRASG